ncbi:MAG: transporter substrate-binding domain-containing protein [Colwellia sp.]|nr:transporter substrate-binding domain-containing protein [Colwellia sp.]MCW8866607.1 transporter substrate-binding domain-containing protein [Colwellia sp.]MCW9082732.1 transporter substrate-binding domain-containing protein [Colwellia sp.]
MRLSNTFLLLPLNILLLVTCFKAHTAESSVLSFTVAAPSSKPFVYIGKQGNPQGLFVDFFSLIKKQTGINITINVMPWVRGMHEVKLGRYDALIPTLYTKEREEFITYPDESLIDFYTVLLKRKGDDFTLNSIAEIGAKRIIAKKRAMSMGKAFDEAEHTGKINVLEVKEHEHAIQMLVLSRVDLVACVEYVCDSSLANLNVNDKVDVVKISDNRLPAYIAFSKAFANKHDINKLMQKINDVKNTSEYKTLVRKYLKTE